MHTKCMFCCWVLLWILPCLLLPFGRDVHTFFETLKTLGCLSFGWLIGLLGEHDARDRRCEVREDQPETPARLVG